MRYILFFVLIICLIVSCNQINNNSNKESMQYPPDIKLKIILVNNSDLTIDSILRTVNIGYNILENTSDIFISESDYLEYVKQSKEFPGKCFSEGNFYIWDVDINRFNGRTSGKTTIYPDSSCDVVNENPYVKEGGGVPTSIMLKLNFKNGKERILAGWPKYYYSKLQNVVKYGFCYHFPDYDKKIKDYKNKNEKLFVTYSINTDDVSGDLTGYTDYTLYSLKVTVNSPDDITMEVLSDTGTPIDLPNIKNDGFN